MSSPPIIRTEGLTKEFTGPAGETVKAVQEVDLIARGGEVLLLLGPSGSGKTTFLSLLAGILPSTAGTVRVGGQELSALDSSALQTFRLMQLGFVFQNARLIDGLSAAENVELPLPRLLDIFCPCPS